MFDMGPVPTRISTDEDLAHRLVAAQFPDWADLPVRGVSDQGWDNQTYHLGDAMLVRLPSAEEYALAVEKEHRWLPSLAEQLPLPIPAPLAQGEPGEGYPHPWSVYTWLEGETVAADTVSDLNLFATDLAGFLAALRAVDPSDGPPPGVHNWFRGGPLTTYDPMAQDNLDILAGDPQADLLREIWQSALSTPWDGRSIWFHGDIARGNLLVQDGKLTAVIDFGTCGVGDPACDLAIAWTLLSAESRRIFRDILEIDDDTWARGRGWALWKALSGYAGAVEDDEPLPEDDSRTLAEIRTDYLG